MHEHVPEARAWRIWRRTRLSSEVSGETISDVSYTEQGESATEQLAVQIYRGLREGGLHAEPVVELACLMGEHDLSCPAVQEILERRTAELTPEEVARLGQDLLTEMGFEPGFDLEPGLWTTLETAVKVVERDVRASGIEAVLGLAIPGWGSRQRLRSGGVPRQLRGTCHLAAQR
ncbi:hypothetical protein Pmi06nite_18810 [Planotetraspora mira]|uniref:Uncharacterized protein n=1 Tax=Planotetraspora mira TaxID=58121 RepID=A0A8J3TPX6_9ACTN|nr:hypothetical protein Pmi06nite_18810 [Planotetraspora mira]